MPKKSASNWSTLSRNPPRGGISRFLRASASQLAIPESGQRHRRRLATFSRTHRGHLCRESARNPDDGDGLRTMGRDDFCCVAGVTRRGLVREESRECIDRGMIIGECRGSLRPSHSSRSAASRTACSEPRPKLANGRLMSTSAGRMPSGAATLAANQAAIASRDGLSGCPSDRLLRLSARCASTHGAAGTSIGFPSEDA